MKKAARVAHLLNKLEAEENRFLQQEFLAPVLVGSEVYVRIAGVVCKLARDQNNFSGWAIFRAESRELASFVREASLRERALYLSQLPQVRLITQMRDGHDWLAVPATGGDQRFQLEGSVPVRFPDGIQLFDIFLARFDGQNFWFDEIDMRQDLGAADYLRTALANKVSLENLRRPGLTKHQRLAYARCVEYQRELTERANAARRNPQRKYRVHSSKRDHLDPVANWLHDQVSHGGGKLLQYTEHHHGYRVTFSVRGRQFTSSVQKEDMTVQSAGICLSGQDRKFDLASLVGVLREGSQIGQLYYE